MGMYFGPGEDQEEKQTLGEPSLEMQIICFHVKNELRQHMIMIPILKTCKTSETFFWNSSIIELDTLWTSTNGWWKFIWKKE